MKKKTDYQVSVRTMYDRLKKEKKAHQATLSLLGDRQRELDAVRNKIHAIANEVIQLKEDNKTLLKEIKILNDMRSHHQARRVDPTAEVVMGMKRAMSSQISATDHLLDAMGDLVNNVSGRKERRDRDLERELDLLNTEDPNR